MTSTLHEVQVSRLSLNPPSNHFRNFGAFNPSRFSPLVLLGHVTDRRTSSNDTPKMKHQKMNSNNNNSNVNNNVSIQYSHNSLQNSHSSIEMFHSNSLQKIGGHSLIPENKSILKKHIQSVVRSDISPYSSYSRERPGSVPCSPRKVDFRPRVIVFHFDSVEGIHVRSESQILTTEPKDRKKFLNRNHGNPTTKSKLSSSLNFLPKSVGTLTPSEASMHIVLPQCAGRPRFPTEDSSRSTASYRSSTPLPFSRNATSSCSFGMERPRSDSVSMETVHGGSESPATGLDFVFFEDESRRLWLRFVVDLGSGVSASDVLVKANLAGNRVRVVGTKSSGSLREEFHERCILPMEVDPHMITARMDGDGRLFIEGLVVTQEHTKMAALHRH